MMQMNDYLEGDYLSLIDKYMPDSGEGENQASQACTAINKLTYKWYNDGDVFDNTHYLRGWWNDLSSYANWLYNHGLGKEVLSRITQIKTDKEYEELLNDLQKEVITPSVLEQLEKKPLDGSIYSEKGIFRFVEDFDDEEDDW